jgi:hypothetical protein
VIAGVIGERAESRDLVSYGLEVALRCHQRVYEGGRAVPHFPVKVLRHFRR